MIFCISKPASKYPRLQPCPRPAWSKDTGTGREALLFVLIAALAAMLFSPAAWAAEQKTQKEQSKFEIETTLESKIDLHNNRDLDSKKDDSLLVLDPNLTVEILYKATDYFEIFTEIEAARKFTLDHGNDIDSPSHDEELNLKQLYFDLEDQPFDKIRLRLGRQEFEDEREWLYDQELDGLRLFYEQDKWSAELSASRLALAKENLLKNDDYDEHLNFYMAYGSYQPNTRHEFNAYTILIDERAKSADEQVLLGLRSRGTLANALDYWAELATVRGQDEGVDLRGYGLDLGATYRFATAFSPSLSLGYAFGSGDSSPEDSRDRSFRQTGIHDNTGSFNGVEDFQLYGEVLDPELSNIHIFTAGLGMRPTEKSSLDLVYHHYRQDEATEGKLRNAWIREETLGESRDLGQGLDIILGYREVRNLQLYASYGLFFPGEAFADSADTAHTFQVGFEYEF